MTITRPLFHQEIINPPSRIQATPPPRRFIVVPAETSDELLTAARRAGFEPDPSIPSRIDIALAATDDRAELGRLHVAKALSLQGCGDASASAAASCLAVPHLLAGGLTATAAFSAAMAAVFLDQVGDLARAVEYAVDAMVILDEVHLDDNETVRAALALSGFFMRMSSFDSAVENGRRAFVGAQQLNDVPLDSVAYSFGYVCAEAAHVTSDQTRKQVYLSDAIGAARWLRHHGTSQVSSHMLAGGLVGEIAIARGCMVPQRDLDAATRLYDDAAPDLVAWHCLVRAMNARRHGDDRTALDLLELAVPGLEASADNHCLVRAISERAEARAALGDLSGAYTDAQHLASLVRSWQVDQVGWLAGQVTRRAELERTTSVLQNQAEQLTADLDQDVTTGCRSRRWLERRLGQLEQADGVGAVLMFDIDRFKVVNDTYGHNIGDAVLARFGSLIAAATTAGHEVARFGGEEFVVIATGHDADAGESLAERIRLDIAAHSWESIAPGIGLTTSVGLAVGRLADARRLLISADEALLEAKRLGRNRTVSSPSFFAEPAPA